MARLHLDRLQDWQARQVETRLELGLRLDDPDAVTEQLSDLSDRLNAALQAAEQYRAERDALRAAERRQPSRVIRGVMRRAMAPFRR